MPRPVAALTIILSACGPIIAEPWHEGGDPAEPCAPAVGEVWGPCHPDRSCDGDADGSFGCMFVPNPNAPQGSICAPLCAGTGSPTCPHADEAEVCGDALGTPTCEVTQGCALACATDKDCGPLLACFGARCLWPE